MVTGIERKAIGQAIDGDRFSIIPCHGLTGESLVKKGLAIRVRVIGGRKQYFALSDDGLKYRSELKNLGNPEISNNQNKST